MSFLREGQLFEYESHYSWTGPNESGIESRIVHFTITKVFDKSFDYAVTKIIRIDDPIPGLVHVLGKGSMAIDYAVELLASGREDQEGHITRLTKLDALQIKERIIAGSKLYLVDINAEGDVGIQRLEVEFSELIGYELDLPGGELYQLSAALQRIAEE